MARYRDTQGSIQTRLDQVRAIQSALESAKEIVDLNDKLHFTLKVLKEDKDPSNMVPLFDLITKKHESINDRISAVENARENLDDITQYANGMRADPRAKNYSAAIEGVISSASAATALIPAAIARLPKLEEVNKVMIEATEARDVMAKYYAIRQEIQQEWEASEASKQAAAEKQGRKAARGVVGNVLHVASKRVSAAASAASSAVSSRLTRSPAASSAPAAEDTPASSSAAAGDSPRAITPPLKELRTPEDGRALKAHVSTEYKDKFLNALLHCDEAKRVEICSMLANGDFKDVPTIIDRIILENPAQQQTGEGLSYNEFQTLNMMADVALNTHVDRLLQEQGIDISPQVSQQDMMQRAISIPPGLTIPEAIHALRKKAEGIAQLAEEDFRLSTESDEGLAQMSDMALLFKEPSDWFNTAGEKLYQDALNIGGTLDSKNNEVTGGLSSEFSARMAAATEAMNSIDQLITKLVAVDESAFGQYQIRKSAVTADDMERMESHKEAISVAFERVSEIALTTLDREAEAAQTIKTLSQARSEAFNSIEQQKASAQKAAADKEATAKQLAYEQSLAGRASRFGSAVLQRFKGKSTLPVAAVSPIVAEATSEPALASPPPLREGVTAESVPVPPRSKPGAFDRFDNLVTDAAEGISGAASSVASAASSAASTISGGVGGVVEGVQRFRGMTGAEKREAVLGNVKGVGKGAGRILGNVFGEGARLLGAGGVLAWNTAADRINTAQEKIEDAVEKKREESPAFKEKTDRAATLAAAAGEATMSGLAAVGGAAISALTSKPVLTAAEKLGEGYIAVNDAAGRVQEAAVQALENNPALERAGAAIGRGAKTAVATAVKATAPLLEPVASGAAALGSGVAGGLNQARLDQQGGGYGFVARAGQVAAAAQSAASTIGSYIPRGGAVGAEVASPTAADPTPSAKGAPPANTGKKGR